ncbi:hypothetical protein [Marinitoga sp. 38H-ov]|uniref:hypothetical protein n=1 Tax=Marinitoga sp. 38H-ov TaxID=1755814 RepID=UPI0013ED22AB|nr:hypothetical protein [Marinitoga sp. 38H-ov]KAF2956034.1 hypothetical protein AS160_07680 [Marinitoga sp. 38H-ov]
MKNFSLILIISLIIIGVVFNIFMINYIYKNSIYRDIKLKKELEKINTIENDFKDKRYSSNIIYTSSDATIIKVIFSNNIEGVIIQEE